MTYQCPVCGYDELTKPPEDYTICPSCGTEFGNDDFDRAHKELRDIWISRHMPWFSKSTLPPKNWNPYRQLIVNYGADLIAHPRFKADVDYRYSVNKAFADVKIAMQLKVTREIRVQPMTQLQLAQKADMKQSRISELEGRDYSSWSISTLQRLATALNVGFDFGFVRWSELTSRISEELTPPKVWIPAFNEENADALSGAIEIGQNQSVLADLSNKLNKTPQQRRQNGVLVPLEEFLRKRSRAQEDLPDHASRPDPLVNAAGAR